jgi:hypothetical protein
MLLFKPYPSCSFHAYHPVRTAHYSTLKQTVFAKHYNCLPLKYARTARGSSRTHRPSGSCTPLEAERQADSVHTIIYPFHLLAQPVASHARTALLGAAHHAGLLVSHHTGSRSMASSSQVAGMYVNAGVCVAGVCVCLRACFEHVNFVFSCMHC